MTVSTVLLNRCLQFYEAWLTDVDEDVNAISRRIRFFVKDIHDFAPGIRKGYIPLVHPYTTRTLTLTNTQITHSFTVYNNTGAGAYSYVCLEKLI